MVIFILLGLSVGSFLNVCIDRLPRGESLARPPSYCEGCNRRLKIWELVPVISYLILGGRCRTCRARVPKRILVVEIITVLLFVVLWLQYGHGPGLQLALITIYTCIFIVLAVIDLEHGLLLNKIVYPSIVLAIVFIPFWPGLGFGSAFIGAGAGFGVLLLPKLVIPSGMGWGDVKAAFLIGLVTGFPGVLAALFMSILVAGVAAAALLALGIRKRKDTMPFGPFLSAGALAALYWGDTIISLYRDWVLFF